MFSPRFRSVCLLAGLMVGGAALPILPSGPSADAATVAQDAPDLATLSERYRRLAGVLSEVGLFEQDRLTVRAFLRDLDARRATAGPEARVLAMDLQLSLWLAEDESRIESRFDELIGLRPADGGLALSALRWRIATERVGQAEVDSAWADLAARFPDSPEIQRESIERSFGEIQYRQVLDAVTRLDFELTEDPALALIVAKSHFAEHDFEAARAALAGLDVSDPRDFRIKTELEQLSGHITDTEAEWAKELEIRAAEATANDLPRAVVETSKGPVVIELFENEAPNTVANFISLARSGFYENTTFHRFLPDFMIQGGDANSKPDVPGLAGTGNPGYLLADEHGGDFTHRMHFRDSVSMAKQTPPNTAGSQFFFNHRPTPWLNGMHTVFGRVIEGTDIARSLRRDDVITAVRIVRDRGHDYTPVTLPLPGTGAGAAGGSDAGDDAGLSIEEEIRRGLEELGGGTGGAGGTDGASGSGGG
ncbi:MAG: peptidylprolyl isomerase [Phycisphaerales bacterium]